MDKLTEDLQRMIKALDVLNRHPSAASEPIDELLDQLFQQKIDLVGVSLNTAAPLYRQAAQDLAAAITKAERAAKHPSEALALIPSVEGVINRVARLLNSVAPPS